MQVKYSATVLIVEDDYNILDLIRLYLENQGFRCVMASDGSEALKILSDNSAIDLVVLDLMLPKIDGWQICRWVRQYTSLPVIMLTARGEIQDKLQGFDLGADDYIVKPFDPMELAARIKAVLRRSDSKPQQIDLPGLAININSYTVKIAGEAVELTPREIELLHFLASHPDQVFTREFLLQQLWGFDFPGNTRTVDVHINRLREKLDCIIDTCQIKTVWGVGYKFVLEKANAKHFL